MREVSARAGTLARRQGPVAQLLWSAGSSSRLVIGVFALSCVIAVWWRAGVLADAGVPPGIDGGNWLAYGRELLGDDIMPDSVAYPPVVPLLVTGLSSVLGPTAGVSVAAGVSAAAPALAVFALLYLAGLRWWAVAIAGFLLPASAISEVAAWGGYPQLLGTASLLGTLWFLDRWLREGARKDLAGGAVAWMLLIGTSNFVTAIGALAAPIVVAIDVAGSPPEGRIDVVRRAGVGVLVAVAVSLPFLPIYIRLVPAMLSSSGSATSLSLGQLPSRFSSSLGGAWPVWALALVLLPVAAWPGRRSNPPNLPVVVALATGLGLLLAIRGEARVLHELPVLAALGAGLWIRAPRESPKSSTEPASLMLAAAVMLALWAVTAAGQRDLPNHRNFYNLLDEGIVRAIDRIRTQTPPGSVVAVSTVRGAPLGWWVEGLARRPTLTSTPLQWLVFEGEREEAMQANELFRVLPLSHREAMDLARSYGADYVMVARGSASFVDVIRLTQPDHLSARVYENSSAVILGVDRSSPEGG